MSLAAAGDRAAARAPERPDGETPPQPASPAAAEFGFADPDAAADVPPGAPSADADGGRAASTPASRPRSKGHRITRRALDHFLDLHRESFIAFGDARIANHVAVGRAIDRLSVRDGVVDLKPQGPLDRYVSARARARAPVDDDAPDDAGDEVARRRRAWDEAKRAGDPDDMTRTANALIRAVDEARAHLGAHEGAHAAPPEGGRRRTSEILNPQGEDDGASPAADDNADAAAPESSIAATDGFPESGTPRQEDGTSPRREREPELDAEPSQGESARVPFEATSESDQPLPLTPKQTQTIARAILAAPEERREEMVRELRTTLGEVIASRVLRHANAMTVRAGTREIASARSLPLSENRKPGASGFRDLAPASGADDESRHALRSGSRGENELREDLPDQIDYARKGRNSRPVLVIGMLGAGGGGNDDLTRLVRDLGGRSRFTEQDAVAEETLKEINAFQRRHPDGIVVVIGYSHGGFDFAHKIAGRTNRPIDIAVFFDPYNAGRNEIELPRGSVRVGFNFYQRNETDAPWFWPFGGGNPFRGSRVRNPEFTNYDLTGRSSAIDPSAKIGHNSIVGDVTTDTTLSAQLNRALRR